MATEKGLAELAASTSSHDDPDPDEWTSLSVKRRTYQRVKREKRHGETFDEVLTRLAGRTPDDANP